MQNKTKCTLIAAKKVGMRSPEHWKSPDDYSERRKLLPKCARALICDIFGVAVGYGTGGTPGVVVLGSRRFKQGKENNSILFIALFISFTFLHFILLHFI